MNNATYLVQTGQSNYDLCLKSLGGFDGFISLLVSNNINNSNNPPNKISINSNNIISKTLSGYNYATNTKQVPLLSYFIPESGDGYFEDENGEIFIPE